MVSLQGVGKTYRSDWSRSIKTALSDINLEIFPGESVGFIGHNGAGKSTTIRLMLGLQRPTVGRVLLRGLDTRSPDSRYRVSYLPENPLLYDYLTPYELLEIGARMHRLSVADLRAHCMDWLRRFEIDEVANRQIRTFSKGMMQRTALAHALCCSPEFLILDEPLSGLDPIGRKQVVEILEEFRRSGRTLFFSSHVLADVERLADRFVFIHEGKIRAVCSTSDQARLEDERYEVVVESLAAPDGFEPISARLWKCETNETGLPELLERIAGWRARGARLYSVKTKQTLERTYVEFVQEASRRDEEDDSGQAPVC